MIRNASVGTVLSPAGKAFLPDARRILDLSAEAALNARRFAECRQHALAIGYIAPALGSFLATSLQVFTQRHPQVKVSLFELSPARQIEALRENRLDIALIGHACPDLAREFDLFEIRRVPVFAVLPESHPLARKAAVSLKALSAEHFIGLDEASFPGRNDFIREACRKAGFTPDFVEQADGLSSALAMIGSGAGVSLMPEEVADLPHRHAVFQPLQKPTVQIEFSAAVTSGEKRPIVRSLLEEFRVSGNQARD
ncbi:MAG: hypothetical protein EOP84_25010 [Verrucomicrobiaceae bacterium]|nr:MAG: hypothetical protein EOP84_25010 [Verrucomicrobiaceae bacterium]